MLAVILYRQLFLRKGKIMTKNNNNQNLYAIQFTRDIINDLTTSELYELYEPEIFRRLKTGDILTNSQAQELVQQGELTYLQENDIIKSAIKGYFLKP